MILRMFYSFLIFSFSLNLFGCYGMRQSAGGGVLSEPGERVSNPSDIALPEGYSIEAVATGFTFPTGVTFDEQGIPYVVEAGYSYGEVSDVPRLLRVEKGMSTVVAMGAETGSWTGVVRHGGAFYVAEGGGLEGGKILRITDDGKIRAIVDHLPTVGDHHANGPAVGPDGWLYFGLGTATNSGIVGEDNYVAGWLKRFPEFHDIACKDVTLTGENYSSKNLFGKDAGDVQTGAFSPFGTATAKGQVIKGQIPCSGAVLKVQPTGGEMKLVAWGFRNPLGLAFSPDGKLYVTDRGYEERGSRPISGARDVLWEAQQDTWYGWPDFSEVKRLDEENRFKPFLQETPRLLLSNYPNFPPNPAAIFPPHSSAHGFDFSRSDQFGHSGEAFVAFFGDRSPTPGTVSGQIGFKVARVDVRNGMVKEFAVNKGKKTGPASALGTGGLERPMTVRFDPSGKSLYVVDFGVLKQTEKGAEPIRKTGVLWRIYETCPQKNSDMCSER